MYSFSDTSIERLNTCHPDLIRIMNEAICASNIDFGIAEGYRSPERQHMLYKEGKSKIDGVTRLGKHNQSPSMAVDIYAFVNGSATWEEKYLCYLGGLIQGLANKLYSKGLISHRIRWGYNWDSDGVIGDDQKFQDLPHFELVK